MRQHLLLPTAFTLFSFLAAPVAAAQVLVQESIDFFAQNCTSCHTIGGGPLAGPDLKGVLERRDREWLTGFLLDPKGVIDSGDPYGQELLRAARGVYMPPPPGMSKGLAGKLLDLIEYESGLDKSQFAGLQISERPLTEADVRLGERLFVGETDFASGAPACISCHTVASTGGLGGGRLGPDLTGVYARLEGRKALAAWLSAPPTGVMQPIYKAHSLDPEEVLALVGYLKKSAEGGESNASSSTLLFLLSGIGVAALFLTLMDFVWRKRYRAVRRTLVAQARS